MDGLALDRSFDGALVFDALHHSLRPAQVVEGVAAHLRPRGGNDGLRWPRRDGLKRPRFASVVVGVDVD